MHTLLSGALGGSAGGAALERELTLGFELDHKRQVEDDMKKRAIQTAGSYEQFRQLVAAATQKPLTPADYAGRVVTSANKGVAAGGGGGARAVGLGLSLGGEEGGGGAGAPPAPAVLLGAAAAAASAAGGGTSAPGPAFGPPPSSPAEFERTWRRLGASQPRLAFLLWLGPARLGRAFRADIDGSMLGPLLLLLGGEACLAGGAGAALALGLVSATPASSLGLALDLLSAEERAAGGAIVAHAEAEGMEGAALLRRCLC